MNIKRLLSLLLVTLLLFCAGCGDDGVRVPINTTPSDTITDPTASTDTVTPPSDTTPTQNSTADQSAVRPLLYRVSDAYGHQAYLFGSIHVGRENFYPLPAYVTNAFSQSDKLAVEFDIVAYDEDVAAQTTTLAKMMYLDGTTIKDHIPEDLYNKAVAIMTKEGDYFSMLDYYYPVLWENTITNYIIPEEAFDYGIDKNLIQKAYKSGKPVEDVESAELQYNMMANYSEKLQIMLLESAVESYGQDGSEEIEMLLDLWATGDAAGLREYLSSEDDELATPEERALYEEYNKAMMTDRNAGMTAYVKRVLSSGETVFVCVGAAHVVSENGIVDQLMAAGYTVEIVH